MATRLAIQRALAASPRPASVEELAAATGLRAPVVELCLWQLEQMGQARCNHRGWVQAIPRVVPLPQAGDALGASRRRPVQVIEHAFGPDE